MESNFSLLVYEGLNELTCNIKYSKSDLIFQYYILSSLYVNCRFFQIYLEED
jgi:hypothetical protein